MNLAVISRLACCLLFAAIVLLPPAARAADRYHSDGDARFLHHIDLYDIDGRKITEDSTRPFSALNTCGRCHEYEAISHGWHFNAFQPDSAAGREGEPWIWTDPKTGTQLPLSYRDWTHTFDPDSLGISSWEMTKQFGGRVPGGNMGLDTEGDQAETTEEEATDDEATEGDDAQQEETDEQEETDAAAEADEEPPQPSRWPLTGALEVDCMVCHAVSGAYDFNLRREQIGEENFAWAPTAALRLGIVDGRVSKIKEGSDPNDEAVKERLPTVTYNASRFNQDGTVFMDLIRKPSSNACYQCHSNRTVTDGGIEPRWIHDDDVHLRAGMDCADCHRNGIDHHMARGYDGEENPGGHAVETLSCAGCHLGTEGHEGDDAGGDISDDILARAGRLGAPKPLHAGLPPLHFDKLSCTACHSGPAPREQAVGIMTSLAHGLGEQGHRTGGELPAIVGPVYTRGSDGRIYPHRSMWPAFWGTVKDGKVDPISPTQVYDLTRSALRVRKDFVEEVLKPKMSSSDLKEILGEDRARTKPADWTPDEQEKVDAAQTKEGRATFHEKVFAALEAIEEELKVEQAAYVSSGMVYVRGDEADTLKTIEVTDDKATGMVSWPLAHNIRPAGWSLGVGGCLECHSEGAKIFASTVSATGPGPDRGEQVTMASLQGLDPVQRLAWNESFRGRAIFKYVVAGSIALLLTTLLVGVGAIAARLAGRPGNTA